MEEDEERLRAELKKALVVLGSEPAKLSLELRKGKDYLRDFIEGRKHSISAQVLAAIRERVVAAEGDRNVQIPENTSFVTTARPLSSETRTIPVFSAVEGGGGAMVVFTDPIHHVERPDILGQADGYAVLVVGESMDPAFEPGDMAIVNKRLPIVRNKDVIFVAGEIRGEFRAMLKRLVRQTDTHWVVRQHNPPLEFEIEKSEWPTAYRVVGKYSA